MDNTRTKKTNSMNDKTTPPIVMRERLVRITVDKRLMDMRDNEREFLGLWSFIQCEILNGICRYPFPKNSNELETKYGIEKGSRASVIAALIQKNYE